MRFTVLSIFISLLVTTTWAEKDWREKLNCTLVEHESNDGDSFHVKVGTRTYVFRLLFIDAPETDRSFPERVAEQAAYWGITEAQAVQLGKEAARFTRDFLQKPFTVFTQFDDAMGRGKKDRDYAIVRSGETDLAVALVSNGLARIYGKQEVPEDGPSEMTMRFRLKSAENDARKNRRGAWALVGVRSKFDQLNPVPPIAEHKRTIQRNTYMYATNNPAQAIGYLTPGRELTVLGAHDATMVKVRFVLSSGAVHEALCRRSDLGL